MLNLSFNTFFNIEPVIVVSYVVSCLCCVTEMCVIRAVWIALLLFNEFMITFFSLLWFMLVQNIPLTIICCTAIKRNFNIKQFTDISLTTCGIETDSLIAQNVSCRCFLKKTKIKFTAKTFLWDEGTSHLNNYVNKAALAARVNHLLD